MRKLAFRAWDVFNGCYTYSDKYGNLARFFEYYQTCIDGGNMIIFEQYTGLKDKNGKEIYEGDIVRWTDTDGTVYTKLIKYNEEFACFDVGNISYLNLKSSGYFQTELEVIGNIYESKNLLGDNS